MLDILLYLQHFNSLLNINFSQMKCGFSAKIDCLVHKEKYLDSTWIVTVLTWLGLRLLNFSDLMETQLYLRIV